MNGFLLDTHVWLWQLAGSEALPAGLREEIETGEQHLWLAPISISEVGLLERRGRVDLGAPLRKWVEEALRVLPLREAPLTNEVAIVGDAVQLPHRDPADRLIAATARVYDLTLMTVDRRLVDAPDVPTRNA